MAVPQHHGKWEGEDDTGTCTSSWAHEVLLQSVPARQVLVKDVQVPGTGSWGSTSSAGLCCPVAGVRAAVWGWFPSLRGMVGSSDRSP